MNLQKLYDYFEIKLEKQVITKEKEVVVEHEEEKSDKEELTELWDTKTLPSTKFSDKNSLENQQKHEELLNIDLNRKKLINIMHSTDIELLKQVHADDLVHYNGTETSQNIIYLQNKNIGTQNILNTHNFYDLKKMAKQSELLQNYNIINLILNAMQTKNLSNKEIETVTFYRKLINGDSVESTMSILPFEWLLKDCADSNCNVESAVASVRFCKIVEKLNQMQSIESEFELKEKHKHILYTKIYQNLFVTKKEIKKEKELKHDFLYLVI